MNIIQVEKLKKNYKDIEAVKDISFNVEEGSFFAFLGINGAGKSTTINILCTVLEKTSGKVLIDGFDLDTEKDQIKKLIGIVFQGHVLDEILTVKQNLVTRASYYGFTKDETKNRIEELSKMLELDSIMNQKYETLSGGQKRRVDIARALINESKILFLDEPTTGLDPQTRVKVWEIIHDLRKKKKLTVFLTTHYMEETANCDSVVILDNGSIVAHDTPHNLKIKYAKNKFIIYLDYKDEYNQLLNKANFNYEYVNDAYVINFENNDDVSSFIINNKDIIKDYEVIKGDMDDVFLNVTGKTLGD